MDDTPRVIGNQIDRKFDLGNNIAVFSMIAGPGATVIFFGAFTGSAAGSLRHWAVFLPSALLGGLIVATGLFLTDLLFSDYEDKPGKISSLLSFSIFILVSAVSCGIHAAAKATQKPNEC